MRPFVVVLALGLVAAAVVVTLRSTSDAAAPEVDEAVVDSARDGDTILLRDGRRVRLLQVDAPELGAGECHARAALEALRSLAPAGGPSGSRPIPRSSRPTASAGRFATSGGAQST